MEDSPILKRNSLAESEALVRVTVRKEEEDSLKSKNKMMKESYRVKKKVKQSCRWIKMSLDVISLLELRYRQ